MSFSLPNFFYYRKEIRIKAMLNFIVKCSCLCYQFSNLNTPIKETLVLEVHLEPLKSDIRTLVLS